MFPSSLFGTKPRIPLPFTAILQPCHSVNCWLSRNKEEISHHLSINSQSPSELLSHNLVIFPRLLMKTPPTVIFARKLATTAHQTHSLKVKNKTEPTEQQKKGERRSPGHQNKFHWWMPLREAEYPGRLLTELSQLMQLPFSFCSAALLLWIIITIICSLKHQPFPTFYCLKVVGNLTW